MIWSLKMDRITSSQPLWQARCWGSWILTPCSLPFVRLALWADCLLLWGLVLAVLPPLFQLEVNEFPHHPGLCQADSCQTSHPKGRRRHPLRAAKSNLTCEQENISRATRHSCYPSSGLAWWWAHWSCPPLEKSPGFLYGVARSQTSALRVWGWGGGQWQTAAPTEWNWKRRERRARIRLFRSEPPNTNWTNIKAIHTPSACSHRWSRRGVKRGTGAPPGSEGPATPGPAGGG